MAVAAVATQTGFRTGVPAGDIVTLAPGIAVPGLVLPYARDAEIFAQESEVEHFFKVVSGAVRITRILADGRRHIVAFHFAGEVFGLEAGAEHHYSAEAVVASRIACVRRSVIASETRRAGDATAVVWRLMAEELGRAQDHALVLGRLSAEERVCAFLEDMAARQGGGDVVDLPMSRIDIADYLGLTIETVSRTLTNLERQGAIGFAGVRRIVLKDRHVVTHVL